MYDCSVSRLIDAHKMLAAAASNVPQPIETSNATRILVAFGAFAFSTCPCLPLFRARSCVPAGRRGQILMELGSDMPANQGADKPKVDPKLMFRAMGIIFIPVAFTMPSGVLVYWTTTNIFGMLQRGLFELRPVQQALGWPMPEDMPQPPAPPKTGTPEVG